MYNYNNFNCTIKRVVITCVSRLTSVNYSNCHCRHLASLGHSSSSNTDSHSNSVKSKLKPKPSYNEKVDDLESSTSSLQSLRDNYLLRKKTLAKVELLKASLAEDNWTPIYSFNHIATAQLVQRAKLAQTGLTCCLILPASLGSYLYGIASLFSVQFAVGGSLFACVMLYIMGTLSSRIVGKIYISDKKPKLVRIARLNFFGQRVDGEFEKSDFVPISDMPDNPSDVYCHLKRYTADEDDDDNDKIMYITFKFGSILNRKEFEDVFGILPIPKPNKK